MRIAVLTNLLGFNPGHSIVSVVADQVEMLLRAGHAVTVYTAEGSLDKAFPVRNCDCYRALFPAVTNPLEYGSLWQYNQVVNEITPAVTEILRTLVGFDAFFTHDWLFAGRMLPYAEAVRTACSSSEALRSKPWMHWVHSPTTLDTDWRKLDRYPGSHWLIYPNETDGLLVRNIFQAPESRVLHIPHARDLRTFDDWPEPAWQIIDEMPGLMSAEIVQVYPASSDRLNGKQVDVLVKLFAEMKRKGRSICLLIANQWATQQRPRQDLQPYKDLAERLGLTGEEFRFSSELHPDYEWGLPKPILNRLSTLANVFIDPTVAESFGLALLEASLLSGCLPVLNGSLNMLREIAGCRALFLNFGSYLDQRKPKDETKWLDEASDLILAAMLLSNSVQTKTRFRREYSLDHIWSRYYGPLLTALVIEARYADTVASSQVRV